MFLFGIFNGFNFSIIEPNILTEPKEANTTTEALSCNLTEPQSPIKGHHWTRNGNVIEETRSTSTVGFTKYK